MTRLGPRKRLFRKVYLFGLLLLFAIAMSVTLVNFLLDPTPWDRGPPELARFVARTLDASEPTTVQEQLDEFAKIIDGDLAVYRMDGSLIAFSGDRRPPPLRADELAELGESHVFFRHGHGPMFAAQLRGGAYMVVQHRHRGKAKFFLVLLAILGVLGVVSWPFARAITRPLEKLTATARALGQGDLSARTGIVRKDEVGALASAFDDMAEHIEALMESERELLANVSHELRTPLARIRVCLELADEEKDFDALQGRLETIRSDLAELETLLDTVLTAARLNSTNGSKLPFDPSPVDLANVLQSAVDRFRELHPKRDLGTTIPEGLDVEVDRAMIRRVFTNLLENAAKYSEPSDPIEIEAGRANGRVWVEVRDRGAGIEEADLERMFEPFFRADKSRARETGGVGLGLSLCKRIVEGHDGEIRASLRDPRGLAFHVSLPTRP